jgi:hypothetical protein
MLVNLGDRDGGPSTLDGCEGVPKDNKMLLNCLENVSCARVGCLTY